MNRTMSPTSIASTNDKEQTNMHTKNAISPGSIASTNDKERTKMHTKNAISPGSIEDLTANMPYTGRRFHYSDDGKSLTQILYQWCVTALSSMDTSKCLPSLGPLELSIAFLRRIKTIDFNDRYGLQIREGEITDVLNENGLSDWGADFHYSVLKLSERVPMFGFDVNLTEASLQEHHASTHTHNNTPKSPPYVKRHKGNRNEDSGRSSPFMGGDDKCHKDCNSETEPARSSTSILEGADDQDSVWSPSRPPASSSKKSNHRGRTAPKKKDTSKRRNNANPRKKSSHQRANTKKSVSTECGSRIIMNPLPQVSDGVPNGRRCLLYALMAHIQDPIIREELTEQFVDNMSPTGDTPISVAINALASHHMKLEPVTSKFNDGCYAYNLLQIRQPCRLLVVVRLWDKKRPKMFTNHCVAWDGSIVHDHPKSVKVNNVSDRCNSANSTAVFERIFHKTDYARWQITNVFELIRDQAH